MPWGPMKCPEVSRGETIELQGIQRFLRCNNNRLTARPQWASASSRSGKTRSTYFISTHPLHTQHPLLTFSPHPASPPPPSPHLCAHNVVFLRPADGRRCLGCPGLGLHAPPPVPVLVAHQLLSPPLHRLLLLAAQSLHLRAVSKVYTQVSSRRWPRRMASEMGKEREMS